MVSAKRLELIVANVALIKVLEILDEIQVNYTVFKDITGKGDLGSKSAENVLTILTNTYILTVCSEEKVKQILNKIDPYIETYGGTYFIQDTLVKSNTTI